MSVKQKNLNKRKKKIKETLLRGIIHVKSTFNNTIVSLSRENGEVLAQESGGSMGYKGAKKSTPYAGQIVFLKVIETAKLYKIQKLIIRIKGIGPGRNSILRALESSGMEIESIMDVTPLAHNGCRPPKKPRS